MSKRLAALCGAGRRAAALWAAFGLLSVFGGCGRQTFDLLDPGRAGAGLGGEANALGGEANALGGEASALGGEASALGGADAGLDAGAGRADALSAGSGGASVDKPCLQREPCADGGLDCSASDCPPGEICHPQTLRCVRGCTSLSDCSTDHGRQVCDSYGACVSCTTTTDCQTLYGHSTDVCFFGMCVECHADQQCPAEKPYCVGLRCQAKH